MKSKKVRHNPFSHGAVLSALPTTASQKEILATLAIDESASIAYNESVRVELKGSLDTEALKKAINDVVKRHDSLRTTFSKNGKNFIVHESSDATLNEIELIPNGESLSSLIENETKKVFNLVQGPLFQFSLVKLASDHSLLFFTAHHIICDGWSLAVILSELSHLYSNHLTGEDHGLSWPAQFNDFALDEIQNKKIKLKDHKEFWLTKYKNDIPLMELPLDFERPKFRTYDSERIDLTIDPSKVKAFKKLAAKTGSSYYNALMSIFEILLHRLVQKDELVIGISAAEQSIIGHDDLVGHLVNLLPIREKINSEETFKEFLSRLKSTMLDAFDHQRFTYGSLLNDLQLERDPSRIPLVNIIFNVDQQYPGQGLAFNGIDAHYVSNPRHKENFEIFINATSCGDSLVLECQYNTSLFKGSSIQNWLEHFSIIIDQILANPEIEIKNIKTHDLKISTTEQKTKTIEEKTFIRDEKTLSRLQNIWEETLILEGIEVEDNFFSIGGHSLLGADICSRVFDEFGIKIDLKDIFENPTILELSQLLINQDSQNTDIKRPLEFKVMGCAEYPLSTSQFQTWYFEKLNPNLTTHNLPASIRLKTKIDHKLLQKTLDVFISRHPSMRTLFKEAEGGPKQVIKNQIDFDFPLLKVNEKDLQTTLDEYANDTFSLENGPLFKVALYKLGKEDYVFFFMVHHIIWDGWCFDIFFKEINDIYSSLVNKEELNLKKPAMSYGDYTLWQNDYLQSSNAQSDLDYWLKELEGELPILGLPHRYPRGQFNSKKGKTLSFEIENPQKLNEFVKKHNTSLYNVFLTAFKMVLSFYSSQDEVIIGTPVRGREYKELKDIIGYFVNTVALRLNHENSNDFMSALNSTQSCVQNAFAHQEIPFKEVLAKLPWDRSALHNPIYQAFFSYQDVTNRKGEFAGHKYSQVNIEKASTHTDLDLWIKTGTSKIEGAFEYAVDLFAEKTIADILESFTGLINSLGNETSETVLLSEKQKYYLLEDLNKTNKEIEYSNFVEIFSSQVQKNPNALAVKCGSIELSYNALDTKSTSWAQQLVLSGVKPGDLVGLSTERNADMLVSLLAILKAGGGYVPLDPGFPQDRLDYMIESSGMKTLLVQEKLRSRFTHELDIKLIESFDDNCEDIDLPLINAASIAYVIYTSGSTGKPKGVELPHKAVANFLTSMKDEPGFSANDHLLAVTTLSFDIAVLELYLPLISGGSVTIATKEEAMSGQQLKDLIEKNSINCMQATPSTWRLLLASGWKGNKDFKLLCGGEPFPKTLANEVLPLVGEVWNMYGPTETTVWSTCKKISLDDESISIGRPIANTDIFILDEKMNLLPNGAVGDLYIGGEGLALGYRGRQDLTSERFVKSPFDSSKLIYNTGDLARYLHNGELECLGRNDSQVKVRGYRIELGEIEVKIASLPNIDDVVVITREDNPGDVRIVAYFISKEDNLNQMSLRKSLTEKLPSYMIPSHFIQMEKFPKTLNEKIDKKNLPAPMLKSKASSKENHKEQDSQVCNKLKELWCDVLGLASIEAEDNFFDIGGHSLLSVQLFSKIAKEFDLDIPMTLLLEKPKFKDFAAQVEKLTGESKVSSSVNSPSLNTEIVKSIVPIKTSGSGKPIFCFHGVGGNVLNYLNLVPFIPEQRALYGVQSSGIDGSRNYIDSIEKMARNYINEMKIVQPTGPYTLAGGSMGGLLAFEVAKQLTAMEDKVEKIIMFDTFGPNLNLKNFNSDYSESKVKTLCASLIRRTKSLFTEIALLPYKMSGKKIPHHLRYYEVEKFNYKALWKYKPNNLEIDLDLIRANSQDSGWYSDENMGWKGIIKGDIRTYKIDAGHDDFIESPYLGPVLKKILNE